MVRNVIYLSLFFLVTFVSDNSHDIIFSFLSAVIALVTVSLDRPSCSAICSCVIFCLNRPRIFFCERVSKKWMIFSFASKRPFFSCFS